MTEWTAKLFVMSMMQSVLSDQAWSIWEPLIEDVRPKGKTLPQNLRRMISAVFWRHQNGTKWHALPSGSGPWWIAAQLFIRWLKPGVWQRLFEKVKNREQALGMVFLDGTIILARHKATGAARKGDTVEAAETVRRLAAHGGRALSFTLSPGQAHERPSAYALLDNLPHPPTCIVCDRGYASHKFLEYFRDRGSCPVIPPGKTDPEAAWPRGAYRHRHPVENLWARLREWRAVAARYEKTAAPFLSVILITATADYIKA